MEEPILRNTSVELRQTSYPEPDQTFPAVVQDCMIQMNLTLKQLSQKHRQLDRMVQLTEPMACEMRQSISRVLHGLFQVFDQKRIDLEKLDSVEYEICHHAMENQMNHVLLAVSRRPSHCRQSFI